MLPSIFAMRHFLAIVLILAIGQPVCASVAESTQPRSYVMPHYVREATPGEPQDDASTSRLAPMVFRTGERAVVNYPIAPPLRVPRDRRAAAAARRAVRQEFTADAGAGINRWWTYEERPIPGIGKAMVNAGTGNLLIQATDLDVPERGLDLVMQRTYNSQSHHNTSGADGADPGIFGNGWTNNYDAHIVRRSDSLISVYDLDGTRCDYQAQLDGTWKPCIGEHAKLELDPQNPDCSYWWIKKSGTAYWFHTPDCAHTTGYVYKIVGRNSNNSITLHYSFVTGQPHTSPNTTAIDVEHSNGQHLALAFALAGTGGPNELATITRPDGLKITYSYDAQGALLQVDRPGNDAKAILPETYGKQSPTQFACGPRATISKQTSGGNQGTDGACLHFDYDSTRRLIDWKLNGIQNFNPQDGFGVLQPDQPTGWRTWYVANIVYGAGTDTPCAQTADGTTTLCDVDGHSTVWTLDATLRVVQTQAATGASSSLTTTQHWDESNNLVAATDARGNRTDYGYDANGNTVEVLQPSIATSMGQLRPTSTYSYDQYNNIVSYCDPVSNVGKSTRRIVAVTPCSKNVGAGNYVYRYLYPAYEPYGQLIDIYTPCYDGTCTNAGNRTQIGYSAVDQGGTMDYGLPTSVKGRSYAQIDGTTREPHERFTYNASGNLLSYITGTAQGRGGAGTWTLTYDSGNMNRVVARRDPDGDTSQLCYNDDGSTRYTQTPYQLALDGGGSCVTSPPSHAVAFEHDTDGNVVRETHHHGGKYLASFPQPTSTPDLRDRTGTTHRYYDGDDRLVEVVQPSIENDVFTNGWITRYFYDITQSNGEPTLHYEGKSEPFAAYGNLYKTRELLPSASDGKVSWGTIRDRPGTSPLPSSTPIVNGTFADLTATAFDALDRPRDKYKVVYSGDAEQLATETLTYDVDNDTLGLLASDCMIDVSECKTYRYDAIAHMTSTSFTINGVADPNTPHRTLTYDPDGRAQRIAQTGSNADSDTYAYDSDGRLLSASKPGSSIAYAYYDDGKRKSTGGSKLGADAFSYAYAPDGTLQQLDYRFSEGAQSGKLLYHLTAAGRVLRREDHANGGNPMTTARTYQHALLSSVVFPCGNCSGKPPGSHASMMYSAEGELLGQLVTAPWSFESGRESQHTVSKYTQLWYYNHRGELDVTFDHKGQTDTRYANGVQIVTHPRPSPPASFEGAQATWDARMGATLGSGYASQSADVQQNLTLSSQKTTVAYDRIGRNVDSEFQNFCSTTKPEGCTGFDPPHQIVLRGYDIENHVTSASASYLPGGSLETRYHWGANGHPKQVGSTPSGGQLASDLLFWDGDALLYSTRAGATDDIKIGADGEYTPSDPGYAGVTFYDRGVDGSVAFCHNSTGGSGGLGDGETSMTQNKYWSGGPSQPCGPATPQSWGMRYATQIAWSASYTGSPRGTGVGHGWTLGQLRADGINDGVNTIQGVRTYDPTAGQWTTPDVYRGNVRDPMSQKMYIWNGNNPTEYQDPSGYLLGYIDKSLVNMIAKMVNNSTVFRNAFLAMASDPHVTYSFHIGQTEHNNPGEISVLPTSAFIKILPGTEAAMEDALADEGGHGKLLATEGYSKWVQDVTNTDMCAPGQSNGCTDNEIKAEATERGTDAQLGIHCECPYESAATTAPAATSTDLDPYTGLSEQFEINAAQAQNFMNAGQTFIQ